MHLLSSEEIEGLPPGGGLSAKWVLFTELRAPPVIDDMFGSFDNDLTVVCRDRYILQGKKSEW